MPVSITGNPILDFAVIQSLSILYLSEAVLPMVKWQASEDALVRELSRPPVAALYEKAAGRRLRMLPDAGKPCPKTTGLCIQVLSRLIEILPNYITEEQSFLAKPSYLREWKSTARLQLQFCLEYIAENPCSVEEISAVLEGGAYLLKADIPEEDGLDFTAEANCLYDKIAENMDGNAVSTMDLAHAAMAVSAWHTRNGSRDRDTFLTSTVLEILNRRSRSGLFHYGPDGYASAPMGQQFFVLNALLRSYPFVMLDTVLEEVFHLFSSLYNVAYKEAFDLFTFKRKNISYTAFDIGAVLSCLDNISRYASDTMEQKDTIDNIRETFLDFIIRSYHQAHDKDIRKLLRWICLSQEGIARMEDKPDIHTIFPKRVQLRYPGPVADWSRKGIVSQADTLFLCSSLLSILEDTVQDTETPAMELDLPALETLRLLFELFHPKF